MSEQLELPPSDLMVLFLDLKFLADAQEMQKPNFFSRTYSNSHGWSGWVSSITRHAYGENQLNNGTSEIKAICEMTNKMYNLYKNNNVYGPVLIEKIKKARDGLTQIQYTYSQLGKRSEASSIETYGVFQLNTIIHNYETTKKQKYKKTTNEFIDEVEDIDN
jgi:hypothetical protein